MVHTNVASQIHFGDILHNLCDKSLNTALILAYSQSQ